MAYDTMINPIISSASVKVMRSYDYCHFEVALSTNDCASLEDVDEMRKQVARLTDRAVEHYKIAREVLDNADTARRSIKYADTSEIDRITALPEIERTPQEQATLKQFRDNQFRSTRRFDYEDDFERDYDEDE